MGTGQRARDIGTAGPLALGRHDVMRSVLRGKSVTPRAAGCERGPPDMVTLVARQRGPGHGGTCPEVLPDACRWCTDAGRVSRLWRVAGAAEQRHRGPGAG